MADRIEPSGEETLLTKKPEVPPGHIMVEAVHKGFYGARDIEVGQSFFIPIQPLSKETGLPRYFSDFRKTVAPGRSGWMKPVDAVELKKITDLEAAFAKPQAAEAPAAAPAAPAAKPAAPAAKPAK